MRFFARHALNRSTLALICTTLVALGAGSSAALAETTVPAKAPIRFNFENADVTTILAAYSKASGRTFVIDPGVRGKATILTHQPVPLEEAYALLSYALSVNGFSILDQDGTLVVMSARNAQRSNMPVLTELPPLKPERMVNLVIKLKHVSAEEINKRLRVLPSKDGELTPFEPSNRLIVTDWVSNLHRITKLIETIDQPAAK